MSKKKKISKLNEKNVVSINKLFEVVNKATEDIRNGVHEINGGLNLIKPDAIQLEDNVTRPEIRGKEMKFHGKDKKTNETIQKESNSIMEEQYKNINQHSTTGLYRKLYIARQNEYVGKEFPSLKKSLKLFTTDVCYGSFFAKNSTQSLFTVYENGVEVKDSHVVDRVCSIIDPVLDSISTPSTTKFSEVDFDMAYMSRRDGYGFVRLVDNKKVLTDLYVKYVLKKAKVKQTKGTESINALNNESYGMIKNFMNDEYDITLPTGVGSECDLSKFIPPHVIDMLPTSLLKKTEKIKDAKKVSASSFGELEASVYGMETFEQFAYRALSGKCSPTGIYRNYRGGESPIHIYSMGLGLSSIGAETGLAIYNDLFTNSKSDTFTEFGIESNAIESTSSMNIFHTNTLDNVEFEDIYAMNTNSIMEKIKLTVSHEMEYALEHYGPAKNKDFIKKSESFSPLELVARNVVLGGTNAVIAGIEGEIISQLSSEELRPGLEVIATNFSNMRNAGPTKIGTTKIERKPINDKYNTALSKNIRIFDNVKGGNVVKLDNRRLIPTMIGGSVNNGAFYIEKTHAEVEHLLASRSVINSPSSITGTSANIFNIDEEEREETVGRLIFSDTVGPLIERNMSTKFLKDNADMMFTIKQALEENETSRNESKFGTMNEMGYLNLSKVSYIPADELVMYTNGDGLGRSLFDDAFVPANAHILANESYLSWILIDGKGMSILSIPEGLNGLSGQYGASNLTDLLSQQVCTRMSLKTQTTENIQLSRRLLPVTAPSDLVSKIQVHDIEAPEFKIDPEAIKQWKEEATSIVGYPASLFSTLDGSGIELAKKIESMNATVVLDIIEAQNRKNPSSNALATKMLHMKGGKEYEKYSVVWNPPRPNRSANDIVTEITEEKLKVVQSYMDVFKMTTSPDKWDTLEPYIMEVLLSKLFSDDKILSESKSIITKAESNLKIQVSSEADEK